MVSAVSAANRSFATNMQSASSFSMQNMASSKLDASRGNKNAQDEVDYAALNEQGKKMDMQMLKDELNYKVAEEMKKKEVEKQNNKK